MNKIYILGIGPGSKDYLLPITERLVEKADVLIGGHRALQLFAGYGKEEFEITADLKSIRDYIESNYRQKRIVVLVSGDPGLYSMLNYLKRYFSDKELEVIPGISSMQLAFARAGLVWQDAEITSLHGSDNKEKLLELVQRKGKIGFFTDSKFPPDAIAQYLLKNGVRGKQGLVCENLSYPDERLSRGSLQQLSRREFGPLTVMIIYEQGSR